MATAQRTGKRWRVMRGIHIVSKEAPNQMLPPADVIYATGDVFESDEDIATKFNGRDPNMESKFTEVSDTEPVSQRPLSRELSKKEEVKRYASQQERSQAELDKLTADIDPNALPTSGAKQHTKSK